MSDFKLKISEKAGEISCKIDLPENPVYLLMLAHGAGAGMDHSFLQQLALAFVKKNVAVVRFNFPYKENGKKLPGAPQPNVTTIHQISKWCQSHYPQLSLFLSGKSYGGRISSHFIAENEKYPAKGLIYFGFPLHAPGKPDKKRADHLYQIKIPQLFLQGTNDSLAEIQLIREVTDSLSDSKLITYENADHSFKVAKKFNGKPEAEMIESLADAANQWVLKIIS